MNFNENELWRDKTELLNLRLSKLPSVKVLFKLEFDTEDQVLSSFKITKKGFRVMSHQGYWLLCCLLYSITQISSLQGRFSNQEQRVAMDRLINDALDHHLDQNDLYNQVQVSHCIFVKVTFVQATSFLDFLFGWAYVQLQIDAHETDSKV